MEHLVTALLAAIGAITAFSYVFSALKGVYARLFRGGKNLKKSYGSWGIVTGATDGIGKAMTLEMAKKGLNVVLISRSQEKLTACQEEIKAKYPKIDVRVLPIDYSKFDIMSRKKVEAFIADLDVGVLVNNVGVSYPFTKYFHELNDEEVENLMKLNVDSTTWMTRIVLPGMVSRNRGAIVNIGSAAGVSTSPLLAQYSAAKSYVAMLSKAMNAELQHCSRGKIHVQCQVPMFVTTKLAKLKHTSLFVASPAAYARAAVAAIGYESLVSPYWSHALQIWLLTNLPEWIASYVALQMHLKIRSAGLKKEAKQAAEASNSSTAADGSTKKKL